MFNILHVSAHYGGGVGTVVNAWIKKDKINNHILTYLNNVPANKKEGQILFNVDMISNYDFIICHIWNHPSMFEFLTTKELPPCRLIGWSHMSGLFPPYVIFEDLTNYFDEFIYTSPISNLTGIRKNFIWSSFDGDEFLSIQKKEHTTFNIGYIGTIDFCKMHPDFITICKNISIPNVKFIILGSGSDLEKIKQECKDNGIYDKFYFMGAVKDIKPFLAEMDLFLYPLYEKHFGTCEQVIGQAMAAGVICVSLNNPAERFILNSMDGFVCKDINSLVNKVNEIGNDFKNSKYSKYSYMSEHIKTTYSDLYYVLLTVNHWNSYFSNLIKNNKRERSWYKLLEEPSDIFIESIGKYGQIFKDHKYGKDTTNEIKKLFFDNRQWYSENKGSIKQYSNYFPEDKYLKEWKYLL